ncbi:MAG: redoxin family protein [Polyangiaceae bacterium]
MKHTIPSFVLCTLLATACAQEAPPAFARAKLANASDGSLTTSSQVANGAKATVFVFYADACPCVAHHIERLRALQSKFAPDGVRFFFVDSEVSASIARDRKLIDERKLPFPILIDDGGIFARGADAEYASYTIVVDASGKVRYHGGIDTDNAHITDDATPFLANALGDLTAGRDVRVKEGKSLGCTLELR